MAWPEMALALRKKRSFPLKIPSVNVTKSAVSIKIFSSTS